MEKIILLAVTLMANLAMGSQPKKDLLVTCQPTQSGALIQNINIFGSDADLYVTMEIQFKDGQKLQDNEALSIADPMDPETEVDLIGYSSENLDLDLNFESGVGSAKAILISGNSGIKAPYKCIWNFEVVEQVDTLLSKR